MTPPPFAKLFRKIEFFSNDGFPKQRLNNRVQPLVGVTPVLEDFQPLLIFHSTFLYLALVASFRQMYSPCTKGRL